MKALIVVILIALCTPLLAQGPYAPQVGETGTDAIHKDAELIVDWASACVFQPGWKNIAHKDSGFIAGGAAENATGKAMSNPVVSLGDSGIAVLTFDFAIVNGPGADFAVFENAFSSPEGDFIELAFVEVSSDGTNYTRFPAVSLTPTSPQLQSYETMDPTNIHNLAGKYWTGYGVPFDLEGLSGTPGLDVSRITHVRIVDVIGAVNKPFTSYDSQGNMINDPWPTSFSAGGFDLDAVGVMNSEKPVGIAHENASELKIVNPAKGRLQVSGATTDLEVVLTSLDGRQVSVFLLTKGSGSIPLNNLSAGMYLASFYSVGILLHHQKIVVSN